MYLTCVCRNFSYVISVLTLHVHWTEYSIAFLQVIDELFF